jgi:hypothetical protein
MNYSNAKDVKEKRKGRQELLFAAFARNSAPFALNNSFDSEPLSFYTFTLVGEFQTFEAKPIKSTLVSSNVSGQSEILFQYCLIGLRRLSETVIRHEQTDV